MKRSIVLSMAVSVLLVSCVSKKDTSVIPIEDAQSKMFLDDMKGGRTYLMLDDSSLDAVVTSMDEVMVDDGKIFISYYSSVYRGDWGEGVLELAVFDTDGRFLNKVGRIGRARNEINRLEFWCLDTQKKEVVIVDSDYSIKRFAYDGTFVSSFSFEGYVPLWDVMYCNGSLYANMLMPNQVADDLIEIRDDGTYHSLMTPRANMQEMGPFSNGGGIGSTQQTMDPGLESFYHLRLFDNVLYRIKKDKVEQCGSFDFIVPVDENEKDVSYSGDMLNTRPAGTYETGSKFIIKTYENNSDRMITALVHYVYDKSTQKCTRYWAEYDQNAGWISNHFKIVGVMGDAVITRATPSGARYILENAADNIPQSDLQMLKVIADRENEALIIHRP